MKKKRRRRRGSITDRLKNNHCRAERYQGDTLGGGTGVAMELTNRAVGAPTAGQRRHRSSVNRANCAQQWEEELWEEENYYEEGGGASWPIERARRAT